jgi:MFS family permease
MIEGVEPREQRSRGHLAIVLAVLFSAISCGATFLFALYPQLALVEVAASLAVGVELYVLSASIGDWIEKKEAPSRPRSWVALALAAGVVCYFLIAKNLR